MRRSHLSQGQGNIGAGRAGAAKSEYLQAPARFWLRWICPFSETPNSLKLSYNCNL